MKRPSRGERRSATTTRHTGSFFPPTRVSRMLTAIPARQDSGRWHALTLAHERREVGHLARLEAAHHLAHLAELLDELVHLLHGGPAPARDPQPPRALDRLR